MPLCLAPNTHAARHDKAKVNAKNGNLANVPSYKS